MLTLKTDPGSESDVRAVFDRLIGVLSDADFSETLFETGFRAFAEYVNNIFETEGRPAWQPLSVRTQEERTQLGFPAEHPILQRTRALRLGLTYLDFSPHTDLLPEPSAVAGINTTRRVLVGNQVVHKRAGENETWLFGTVDTRFLPLAEGTDDIPPRPMVPMGEQQREVGKDIEKRLVALLRRRIDER